MTVRDLSKPPRPDEIKASLAAAIRGRRFELLQSPAGGAGTECPD